MMITTKNCLCAKRIDIYLLRRIKLFCVTVDLRKIFLTREFICKKNLIVEVGLDEFYFGMKIYTILVRS